MIDALRPFLAAILSIPLRMLAGWLAAHGYAEITGEQIDKAVYALLVWILPVLSALGIIFRRLVDKKANPGNAASSHVARVEKDLSRDLKAGGVPGRIITLPPDVVAQLEGPLPPIEEPPPMRWSGPPTETK